MSTSGQSQSGVDAYAHLVGHRFPGARVTLPPYAAWLWADAVGAAPDAALAHPSMAHLVGLRGTGMTIAEILALLDATADDGVLLGETDFAFAAPLVPGATYDCDGEIVSVRRKRGARAGVFDLLTFTVRIREPGGDPPVATCSFTMVFPRREA